MSDKVTQVEAIDTSKKQVDKKVVDKLVNPSPLFKKFEPTPDKIKAFARHLMDNKLSLSDEYRNYDIIYAIINKYMFSQNSILYEIGDMDGIFGFTDIIIGWKCHVIFELMNQEIAGLNKDGTQSIGIGKRFARESKALFDLIMKTGDLIKMSSQTADDRVFKMAKMVGFHQEGLRQLEFSWTDDQGNKKPYDIYLLGRIRADIAQIEEG